MNVTDYLIKQSKGEFVKQPEVSDPSKNWSMFNDGGIECETGELLHAFVREIKPQHVLETGTHRGVGAAYIGQALKENGFGMLDTHEFLAPHFKYSWDLMVKLKLGGYVSCHMGDVAEVEPTVKYDLMLLDTEPQTRFAELIKFEKYLKPGGFVFIHDLHRHMHQIPNEEHGFAWPYGPLPQEVKDLVKNDILRPFHFGTPRGLTGFYKTHEGDHKWS